MSFTYSVIGDNTPKNRGHLEKLGYEQDGQPYFTPFLLTKERFYYRVHESFAFALLNEPREDLIIDCRNNSALFQAVTAMRDDNHIHQWHIIDYEVYLNMPKGYWFIATNLSGGKHVGCQIDPMYCHKATLSELQEHFK